MYTYLWCEDLYADRGAAGCGLETVDTSLVPYSGRMRFQALGRLLLPGQPVCSFLIHLAFIIAFVRYW